MFRKEYSFSGTEMKLLLAVLEKKIPDLNTAEKYFLLYAERFYEKEYTSAIFTVLEKETHDKVENNEDN